LREAACAAVTEQYRTLLAQADIFDRARRQNLSRIFALGYLGGAVKDSDDARIAAVARGIVEGLADVQAAEGAL
jgi:hypothetical protein